LDSSHVRFSVPVSLSSPGVARHRLRAHCDGLSEEQRSAVELLTSELVTNAVLHPTPFAVGAAADIDVRVARTDSMLRVEVADHDDRPLPPPSVPTTPTEPGRGLGLVAELASSWGSRPASSGVGKVVWFEISLPVPE